jgi:hypothetical protein
MDSSLCNKIRCLSKRLDIIESLISKTDIQKNTENRNSVINNETIVTILNYLLKLTNKLANSEENVISIIDLENINDIMSKLNKNLENIN